jgi:glycosyltransferase involved in cell wall biosynthesis
MTLRPVAGVNDVRVRLPCERLATRPGVRVAVEERSADTNLGEREPNKIFLWQRPILRYSMLPSMQRLIAKGYVIVVEFDDHPKVWPDIAGNDYLNYRGVHAVQTSTEPLRALLSQHNPNVEVFPNAIAQLPPWRERAAGTVNVFFGALNRGADWAPLMPALNQVLRGAGARAHVTVVADRRFFDALATPHKTFHPMLGYDAYLAELGAADINLLPLLDDEFRRMKSDLKFIESAACGAVALASPTVYAGSLRDGETGVLFRTPAEFGARLGGLIADPARRRALARAAWEYVERERLLEPQIDRRLEWYRGLCARRETLARELYDRVPQLRS